MRRTEELQVILELPAELGKGGWARVLVDDIYAACVWLEDGNFDLDVGDPTWMLTVRDLLGGVSTFVHFNAISRRS